MSYSPDKSTWFNPDIEYLFNGEIVEYDMQSASLSLIKEYELLPPDKINELSGLDKLSRNVAIGKLQRDVRGFSSALLEKFVEIRAKFIVANSLTDDRILTVKKDAIFTIEKCQVISFGQISFVPKSTFSSYLRFPDNSNIELYLSDRELTVKGIGEIGLARHRLYLLEFLRKMMMMIESRNPTIRRHLISFIDEFKRMELDDGYYVELNNMSQTSDPVFNLRKVIVPIVQIVLEELRM